VKITAIETVPVRIGVDRCVGDVEETKGFRFASEILLILVRTDGEIEGVGESNGSPDWSGETCLGAKTLIERHLAPRLIGEDPRRIRHCLGRLEKTFANPFAKAGIEMALFDILGKSSGAPLYQVLGGAVRSLEVPQRFPLFPVGPAASATVAADRVAKGYSTIKLKVGHDPLAFDLERVRRVREAVGPDVRLTVDANGGWSVQEAICASAALEDYGVDFVEQPVHRLDLDGLARVRQRTRLPVMADEAVFTVRDALTCIQKDAADIISVYPGKNGGILNTVAITQLAAAAGVHCSMGSNLEWDVASAAMAHVTVALPNIVVERYAADIIGPAFHTEHAIEECLAPRGGHVTVPQGPGLGVTVDTTKLQALQM
jgi:L-alanine-DL-glutamate epimerase-like enolase superfamily enzyme